MNADVAFNNHSMANCEAQPFRLQIEAKWRVKKAFRTNISNMNKLEEQCPLNTCLLYDQLIF